ncbi:MAG: hypothetical protein NPIRA04_24170 [Nitrospirales bacterium]|nr:MAG: hypothetical protein NPIRA04_24170 [Nitrospirales bacterium]
MIKRSFDFLGALCALLLCSPIFVLIAVFIKLESRGPIFFSRIYVGKGFRHFFRYKFRTMIYAEPQGQEQSPVVSSHCFTRIGRLLRQFKLDELPQLINVLKGEMSLVGPRPEVPYYVNQFRDRYEGIIQVRPGLMDLSFLMYVDDLTVFGTSTIKPPVSESTYLQEVLPEKIRLANLYIEHRSFAFDLAVIAQTLLKLFGMRTVLLRVRASQHHNEIEETMVFKFLYRHKRVLIPILDVSLIVLANYIAFWLRFDGQISSGSYQLFTGMLPWLILIRGISFFVFRLNEGLWRYVSIWDVKKILVGVLSGSLAFYVLVAWILQVGAYPRSVYIIDAIMLIGFLVGIRVAVRLYRERKVISRMKRVLVIGAGDAGAEIVREMQAHPSCTYVPIGFVDDDPAKLNKRIHGVKVLGARHDLVDLLPMLKPEEVLVALPSASAAVVRDIMTILSPFKLQIKTLPKLEDILNGHVSINQIRSLAIEDLLQRPSVNLRPEPVAQLIKGKRVFITGAGGSIGSELCRQIVGFEPEALILYERHENSLYTINSELDDHGHAKFIYPVLGDITDAQRLESTMQEYRPDIVFHAAAHKHVPLMEMNPSEAFKNNVLGTWAVADMANQYGVEHFVLISTDKAVNPSSVMGATKRAAELVIQGLAGHASTCFLTVRFGNVLGSNGSVVPRFQQQINAGGPVTVTHPEVRRYFMSIPEAVGLVLQAATLGEQGSIYLLEMGEQIKLVDLARNLIKLSGHLPDKDISIEFIGLRPGEKLQEELVGHSESTIPSSLESILKVHSQQSLDFQIFDKINEIKAMSVGNDSRSVLEHLQQLVPTFCQISGIGKNHSESSHIPTSGPHLNSGKKRILIVDDDRPARKAIRTFLESQGYICAEADHGALALKWLETQHADLIITDNRMPVLGGFEFLERLKGGSQTLSLPVVVFSGHLNEEDKKRVLHYGVCAVFEKQESFSEILPVIDRVLEKI